jgi:acylphosphatase
MKGCIHCLVSGRVQGVFFRASAQAEAQRLGVAGWARNLRDGRVEVMACGDTDALARFREWLGHGPPQAEVEDVTVAEQPFDPSYTRFDIG